MLRSLPRAPEPPAFFLFPEQVFLRNQAPTNGCRSCSLPSTLGLNLGFSELKALGCAWRNPGIRPGFHVASLRASSPWGSKVEKSTSWLSLGNIFPIFPYCGLVMEKNNNHLTAFLFFMFFAPLFVSFAFHQLGGSQPSGSFGFSVVRLVRGGG